MKRAIVEISDHLLTEILKPMGMGFRGTFEVVENGLPADAKPCRIFLMQNGTPGLLVESEEFDDVPFGKEYPVLPPPIIRVTNENEGGRE